MTTTQSDCCESPDYFNRIKVSTWASLPCNYLQKIFSSDHSTKVTPTYDKTDFNMDSFVVSVTTDCPKEPLSIIILHATIWPLGCSPRWR